MHCKNCGSNLTESICHYCQTDSGVRFVTQDQYNKLQRFPNFIYEHNHKEVLGYINHLVIVGDWL